MYPWIWNHLPEPFALRVVVAVLLVLAVLALLMGVVFPWVEGVVLPASRATTG